MFWSVIYVYIFQNLNILSNLKLVKEYKECDSLSMEHLKKMKRKNFW